MDGCPAATKTNQPDNGDPRLNGSVWMKWRHVQEKWQIWLCEKNYHVKHYVFVGGEWCLKNIKPDTFFYDIVNRRKISLRFHECLRLHINVTFHYYMSMCELLLRITFCICNFFTYIGKCGLIAWDIISHLLWVKSEGDVGRVLIS